MSLVDVAEKITEKSGGGANAGRDAFRAPGAAGTIVDEPMVLPGIPLAEPQRCATVAADVPSAPERPLEEASGMAAATGMAAPETFRGCSGCFRHFVLLFSEGPST